MPDQLLGLKVYILKKIHQNKDCEMQFKLEMFSFLFVL